MYPNLDDQTFGTEDDTSKVIESNQALLKDENEKRHDKNKTMMAEKLINRAINKTFPFSMKLGQDDHFKSKTFKEDPLEFDTDEDQEKPLESEEGTKSKNILTNGSSKPNYCGICKKSFKFPCVLKSHYKSTHQNIKEFDCKFKDCNKSFSSMHAITRHVKDVHYRIKNFKCESCDKLFCQKSQLQAHMKSIHVAAINSLANSKDDPNFCDSCDKTFSTSGNLKTHIKNVHNADNQKNYPIIKDLMYNCGSCDKSFFQKTQLREHIKSIHNQLIINHFCDRCNKSFSYSGHLKNHIANVHEKPPSFATMNFI